VIPRLPRPRGEPQSSSLPSKVQTKETHREPTSTGTRSREFGKQTLVERIGGACPALRCKALRRERCLARRKPSPRWVNPDDEGRWREGEDGAQFSHAHYQVNA